MLLCLERLIHLWLWIDLCLLFTHFPNNLLYNWLLTAWLASEKDWHREQWNDRYRNSIRTHQLLIDFGLKTESLTVSKLQMEFYRQWDRQFIAHHLINEMKWNKRPNYIGRANILSQFKFPNSRRHSVALNTMVQV